MTHLSSRKGFDGAPRPRGVKSVKRDPVELTAATVARLRETISSSVPPLIEQYVANTGLRHLGEQFQVEVVQAVFASVLAHSDAPKRRRNSVVRKQMKRLADEASALAKQLCSFQTALDEVIPIYRSDVIKGLELPLKTELAPLKLERTPSFLALKFGNVSNRAGILAQMFSDKGGKPSMFEFRLLVQSLGQAFERGMGRPAKVTRDLHGKYAGDFLELVETVLPLTRDCAQQFGWELSHPLTTSRRGKYVYEHTRVGKLAPQTAHQISDWGA